MLCVHSRAIASSLNLSEYYHINSSDNFLDQLCFLKQSLYEQLPPGDISDEEFFHNWATLTDNLINVLNQALEGSIEHSQQELFRTAIDDIINWCDLWAEAVFPAKYPAPFEGGLAAGVLIMERIVSLCRAALYKHHLLQSSEASYLARNITKNAHLPFSYIKGGVYFVAERMHDITNHIFKADGYLLVTNDTGAACREKYIPAQAFILTKPSRKFKLTQLENTALKRLEEIGVNIGPKPIEIQPLEDSDRGQQYFIEIWDGRTIFNFKQLRHLDFAMLPKLSERLRALAEVSCYLRVAADLGFSWRASLAALICFNRQERAVFGLGVGRRFYNDRKSFQRNYRTVARLCRQTLCVERPATATRDTQWPTGDLSLAIKNLTSISVVDEAQAMDALNNIIKFLWTGSVCDSAEIALPLLENGWVLPLRYEQPHAASALPEKYLQDWEICHENSEALQHCDHLYLPKMEGVLSWVQHETSLQKQRDILKIADQELFVVWQDLSRRTADSVFLASPIAAPPQLVVIKAISDYSVDYSYLALQATNSALSKHGGYFSVLGLYKTEQSHVVILPYMGACLHRLVASKSKEIKMCAADIAIQMTEALSVLDHNGIVPGDFSLSNWVLHEEVSQLSIPKIDVYPIDYDRNFLTGAFNLPLHSDIQFSTGLIAMQEAARHEAHLGSPPFYHPSVIIRGDQALSSRELVYSVGLALSALISKTCFNTIWDRGQQYHKIAKKHAKHNASYIWRRYLGAKDIHLQEVKDRVLHFFAHSENDAKQQLAAVALDCMDHYSWQRPSLSSLLERLRAIHR